MGRVVTVNTEYTASLDLSRDNNKYMLVARIWLFIWPIMVSPHETIQHVVSDAIQLARDTDQQVACNLLCWTYY